MAILETVKKGQRYINLNPGHLFVQKGKGSKGSFKLEMWAISDALPHAAA